MAADSHGRLLSGESDTQDVSHTLAVKSNMAFESILQKEIQDSRALGAVLRQT